MIRPGDVEAPRAVHGDAFERVYRAYASPLRAAAYAVLRDAADAEDCVHAALVRALGAGAYDPRRGALYPYLLTCVRNEAIAMLRATHRRHARERRFDAREPRESVDEPADPVEAARVRAALARLPPEQREAIVLAYYGGRTHLEIARERDLPLGTVKSRIAAALRRLAAELASGGTP